jgi:hypothetical protein
LHYVANGHQDPNAFALGFNLSDTGPTKATIDALPDGVRALVWVGNGFNSTCSWALSDADIQAKVGPLAGDPKVYGYFVSDEPHPSTCPDAPAQVNARSKLIHSIDPAAKTFIVVLEGSSHPGEYAAFAPTDIDLIGLDPYPCNLNNAATGCSYQQIDQRVATAQAAGISPSRIVPVFQTFGQACATSKYYRLPSTTELQTMLDHWHALVPSPAFDYSYGWSNQSSACPTLADAPDLQSVIHQHNT